MRCGARPKTVLGLIDPADLGTTLMHEHLIWNITPPSMRTGGKLPPLDLKQWWNIATSVYSSEKGIPGPAFLESNTTQLDRDVARRAVAEVIEHGGRAIVELSIGGLCPDPVGLAQVARATGANIVMGCGHYVHDYQDPANADRSVDELTQEMIDQVQQGAWGTRCAGRPAGRDRLPMALDGSGEEGARRRRRSAAAYRCGADHPPGSASGSSLDAGRVPACAWRGSDPDDHRSHRPHHLRRRPAVPTGGCRRGAGVGPVRPGRHQLRHERHRHAE